MGKIADTLANAGHDVVVYQPILQRTLTKSGSTNPNIRFFFSRYNESESEVTEKDNDIWEDDTFGKLFHVVTELQNYGKTHCDFVLGDHKNHELLKEEKFDITILQASGGCIFGVLEFLEIKKYIVVYSSGITPIVNSYLGIPQSPSFLPSLFSSDTEKMSFLQRTENFIETLLEYYTMNRLIIEGPQEALDEAFLKVNINKKVKDAAFLFVNSDELVDFTSPITPKTIYIGALGRITQSKLLEQKYLDIFNSAKRGVIYFSFGTVVLSKDMPPHLKNTFLDAFSEFPDINFIWKYENESHNIAESYNNVFTFPFLPQNDLLDHTKLLAFITHGGMNSITEAAIKGVPMIAIPIFGDQNHNARILEAKRTGITLLKCQITKDLLISTIRKIIDDESYMKNAKQLSRMVMAKPMTAEERVVKYTEFAAEFGDTEALQVRMMNNLFILILLLGILATVEGTGEDDRIGVLPGVNFHYNFSQYSGYLNAGEDGKWKFFYWLIESQTMNSDNDPLVVVLSAGPGCSSLGSLFEEFGPFYVKADGRTVYENIFAWNKYANILAIESPIGTGFSYSVDDPMNYTVGDDLTSSQNLAALVDFFTNVQPKYNKRQWFIAGESYGGVYVSSLTRLVLQSIQNKAFPNTNFSGSVIGNGFMNIKLSTNALILWANYHGIIGVREWDIIKKKCCANVTDIDDCPFFNYFNAHYRNSSNDDCGNMLLYYLNITSVSYANTLADPFNFYQDCYKSNYLTNADTIHKFFFGISHAFKSVSQLNYDSTDTQFGFPCYNQASAIIYLNQPEVQKAFHVDDNWIKSNKKWQTCNNDLFSNYPITYMDTTGIFNDIIKIVTDPKTHIPTFRILIYDGDVDTVCNFLGNARHINSIVHANSFDYMPRYPWIFRNRLAGYHQPYFLKYNNGQNALFIDALTVKGAGHPVANDRPGPASQIFYNFIKNIGHYNFTEGFNETPSPMPEASSLITNTLILVVITPFIVFLVKKLV